MIFRAQINQSFRSINFFFQMHVYECLICPSVLFFLHLDPKDKKLGEGGRAVACSDHAIAGQKTL